MSLRARAACLAALALPALLVGVVGCAADTTSDSDGSEVSGAPHILAIGDSISFGWNPLLENDPHKVQASNYRGFAEVIGQQHGYVVDNAACPGEASGSFIDAKQKDNGCRDNRAAYKLHVDWDDYVGHAVSTQLDFTRAYLERSMAAGRPPKLITLTLGGNDLLLLQKGCDLPGPLKGGCELVRLPFYAHAYEEHLEAIFDTIESSGYTGPVAVVTTYAPDYSDHIANIGVGQIDSKLKEAVGHAMDDHPNLHVVVADGYAAFKAYADKDGGKTCATGLLIKKPDGTCDIHPTPFGHSVLADTIEAAVEAGGQKL